MTVYYVDMAVGDDANLGTSEGAGNAWKTLTYAESQVVAGDKVWVKASASYTETLTVLVSCNSFQEGIVFEGYETTPGDNGQVTIDGESTRTYGLTDNNFLRNNRGWFNFRFINHTSHGVGNFRGGLWVMANCYANNNGGTGISAGGSVFLANCHVENSSQGGHAASVGIVNLKSNDNTQTGGTLSNFSFHNLYYGNNAGASTVNSLGLSQLGLHGNITVDHTPGGNSDCSGTFLSNRALHYHGMVLENGLYGVDCTFTANGLKYRMSNFLIYNMTTAAFDDSFVAWGSDNYENDGTAPDYVDQANADYRPAAASPLVGLGLPPRVT